MEGQDLVKGRAGMEKRITLTTCYGFNTILGTRQEFQEDLTFLK